MIDRNPWLLPRDHPDFGRLAAEFIKQRGTRAADEAAAQAHKTLSGAPRKVMVGTAEYTEDAIFRSRNR